MSRIVNDVTLAACTKERLVITNNILDDISIIQPLPIVVENFVDENIYVPNFPVQENYGNQMSVDFDALVIPIDIFDIEVQAAINNSDKLNDWQVSDVIKQIHRKMRNVQPHGHISESNFRKIVRNITQQYPACFLEKAANGEFIADSAEYLINKLKNIDQYQTLIRTASSSGEAKKRGAKRMRVLRETTLNFDTMTNIAVANEDPKPVFEMQEWLKEIYQNIDTEDSSQRNLINSYMQLTYEHQRSLINFQVEKICEAYPFLSEREFIFKHFRMLMGFSIDRLVINLNAKTSKTIAYIQQLSAKTKQKAINDVIEYDETIALIKLLCVVFKEDADLIFKKFKVRSNHFFPVY
jgi:hypothetical protein